MSRSEILLAAAALLLGARLHAVSSQFQESMANRGSGNAFLDRRAPERQYDKNELRAQVDETQGLLDALARETRGLDKAAHEELLKSLRDDYALGGEVGDARGALKLAEEVLDIQDAIKRQQARLRDVLGDTATAQREESSLLGLQSDLMGAVEDLRKALTSQHKGLGEAAARDYRNWMMVGEGLLRRRREAAEARAAEQPAPEAAPISAPARPDGEGPEAAPQPLSPAARP